MYKELSRHSLLCAEFVKLALFSLILDALVRRSLFVVLSKVRKAMMCLGLSFLSLRLESIKALRS